MEVLFRVGVGGEAVLELLKEIRLEELVDDLRRDYKQRQMLQEKNTKTFKSC